MEANPVTSQPSAQMPPSPLPAVAPAPPPSATPPKKSRSNWLLIVGLAVVIFLLGIVVGKFYPVSSLRLPNLPFINPSPTPSSTPTPTPTIQPSDNPTASSSATLYSCPPTGYVDCMPVLDEAKKKACSPEAMTWYKVNCPDFKGGAL